MKTHSTDNIDQYGASHTSARLVPRKPAYREALSISDPTIWRWTRQGKLSPADAVINGREYSTPQTIESDVRSLMGECLMEGAE